MPVINVPPSTIQHKRVTIAFTGGAGLGAVGVVTLFTITGRVIVRGLAIVCTESLAGANATLKFGVTGSVSGFVPVFTATDLTTTNNIPTPADGLQPNLGAMIAAVPVVIAANIIGTVAVAAISDGTIVVDVYCEPLTDNGALA